MMPHCFHMSYRHPDARTIKRLAVAILISVGFALSFVGTSAIHSGGSLQRGDAQWLDSFGETWTWLTKLPRRIWASSNHESNSSPEGEQQPQAEAQQVQAPEKPVIIASAVLPVEPSEPLEPPPPPRRDPPYVYPSYGHSPAVKTDPSNKKTESPITQTLVVVQANSATDEISPVAGDLGRKSDEKPLSPLVISLTELPATQQVDLRFYRIALSNSGTSSARLETVVVDYTLEPCSTASGAGMALSQDDSISPVAEATIDMTSSKGSVQTKIDGLSIPPKNGEAGKMDFVFGIRRSGTPEAPDCGHGQVLFTVSIVTDAGAASASQQTWVYAASSSMKLSPP
ncbi:MAG TPA: hypothetical protein VHL59_09530 [Thermoanaerobaculia bacterium]|nr:hypothetical protein [Thermoanaerobaculia bacterium]